MNQQHIFQAAVAAMQGLLSQCDANGSNYWESHSLEAAKFAVDHAHALVAEVLKRDKGLHTKNP